LINAVRFEPLRISSFPDANWKFQEQETANMRLFAWLINREICIRSSKKPTCALLRLPGTELGAQSFDLLSAKPEPGSLSAPTHLSRRFVNDINTQTPCVCRSRAWLEDPHSPPGAQVNISSHAKAAESSAVGERGAR
jgi:hypothetical protein